MLFLFILFLDNIWKRSVKPYYSSLNTSLLDPFLFMSLMLSVKWKKHPHLITTVGTCTVTLQQGRENLLQKIWRPHFFQRRADWIFAKGMKQIKED